MALPFVLLLIALALRRASSKTPDLLLPALLLGLLYPLNSWDYPTYLLLYVGAMIWYGVRNSVSLRDIARELGIVAVVWYVWYLPFHLTFIPCWRSSPIS
jgi:hypothetical protein